MTKGRWGSRRPSQSRLARFATRIEWTRREMDLPAITETKVIEVGWHG